MAKVRIQDNSKAVLARIEQNIHDLLESSSEIVRDDAKINTPVAPGGGALRSSITNEVRGSKAFIGSNLEYAARIELGYEGTDRLGREYVYKTTWKTPKGGYNMLTNALRNNSKAILKLFKDKLLK